MAIAAALALLAPTAAGENSRRTWHSADGSGSFDGVYLNHDEHRVRIRRDDNRIFTIDLEKLRADDRDWLRRLDSAATPDEPTAADESAVFDSLKLGDLHADVRRKLADSRAVELAIDATYLARLGLNGSYRTRHDIGGQRCLLYFDWTAAGESGPRLRELSLQTEPLPETAYPDRLQATWSQFSDLLTKLHGRPLQAGRFPERSELTADGIFLGSHLWRLENGHSAILGTAREGGRYSVIVRFTVETIQPVRTGPTP